MKNISRQLQASILTVITFAVFGGIGLLLSYSFYKAKNAASLAATATPLQEPIETVIVSEIAPTTHPLTGLPWDGAPTSTRPFAVAVDNAPEARPQWGLAQADIVINSPVEGGITRLVAFFSSQKANKIGPVRSARPYFLRQAQDLEAIFVHSGGSAQALAMLEQGISDVADLNEFANGPSFWRTNAAAPHNLFTSTDMLRDAADKRDYSTEFSTASPWQFSSTTPSSLPTTTEITIPYPMQSMAVRYHFNLITYSYERTHNGNPHRDAASGKPLSPANVLVEFHSPLPIQDPYNYGLVNFSYEGSGELLAFTRGKRIEGKWMRSTNGPMRYTASVGGPLTLSPGQTFIEVVPINLKDAVLHSMR